ncbi:hypothetical protein NDU88_002430 [Pleurodeles waltl]|uniref:Uncharacterized protein n=1 Tax=Pleurodeles waltl TaxID=8319 RepID=A0AAV7RFD4_PLEWA|nr:hypothetical protein NDU88_002430 [Pleurodeles waltl]
MSLITSSLDHIRVRLWKREAAPALSHSHQWATERLRQPCRKTLEAARGVGEGFRMNEVMDVWCLHLSYDERVSAAELEEIMFRIKGNGK